MNGTLIRSFLLSLSLFFFPLPVSAGDETQATAAQLEHAALIVSASESVNREWCEFTAAVAVEEHEEKAPPDDPVAKASWADAWKKVNPGLKWKTFNKKHRAEIEKQKEACLKDGSVFWAAIEPLLVAAFAAHQGYEFHPGEKVRATLKEGTVGYPFFTCSEGIECQRVASNCGDNQCFVVSLRVTAGDDKVRVSTLELFSPVEMNFTKVVRRTYAVRGSEQYDDDVPALAALLPDMVAEFFGVPKFVVTYTVANESRPVNEGERVKTAAQGWKVSVEGRQCAGGIMLEDQMVTNGNTFVIAHPGSEFLDRPLTFTCTGGRGVVKRFVFTVAPPPKPPAGQNEACKHLRRQLRTDLTKQGPVLALTRIDESLADAQNGECKSDASLKIAMARAYMDLGKLDPTALARAVDLFQELSAPEVLDRLGSKEREEVSERIAYFAETFFAALVSPQLKNGDWMYLAVAGTGIIKPVKKSAFEVVQRYYARTPIQQPTMLYLPKGGDITINGQAVRLVTGIAQVKVAPDPDGVAGLRRLLGIVEQDVVLPPEQPSVPLGIIFAGTLAGAAGEYGEEGAYSRGDFSLRYPIEFGPVGLAPRATLGGVSAFGGVRKGADERWAHIGFGLLLEFPRTLPVRLVLGADGLYSFGRGFGIDPEASLCWDVTEDVSLNGGWVRSFTFWDDADIVGVGLGFVRLSLRL